MSKASLYINSKGYPVTRHSYSARIHFTIVSQIFSGAGAGLDGKIRPFVEALRHRT